MPRVLRIINRLNLGRPTYNVSFLTKFLAPEFETLLMSGAIDDTEESSEFILDKYNIQPVYVHEMKRQIDLRNDRAAYLKIKKTIKEFKPDIVHTHMAKPGTVGRLAALHCKVPIILHTFHGHYFHSYFNPLKTSFFLQIERYLAKKTSGIVVLSDVQKHELCNIHKVVTPDKGFVVPLGFDLSKFNDNSQMKRDEFRRFYNLNDDVVAIGIIGRLVPVKNHKLFIDALKYVLDNTSKKVRAFIIGDGEERANVEQLCLSSGIDFTEEKLLPSSIKPSGNAPITFTSWIKEIDHALAGLDIVALTSFNEGTPVSLIEAQAASKPIVSTNVGGIENVVIPGVTALLSERNDINKFSANLLQLVENSNLRQTMSEKGWEHVREKFHYTRLVEDMRQLYWKLLKPKQ